MLYDYIIIYDYKKEGKKERKKRRKERNTTAWDSGTVRLKGHLCTLFTEKSFIVVH